MKYLKEKLFFMFGHIRDIKIQTRLLSSFLFLSLVPLLTIGIISYNKFSRAIESKIGTYSVQIMNELSKEIQIQADAIQNMCDEIILYEPLQYGLANYNSLEDAQKADIITQLDDYFYTKRALGSSITDFEIFTKDNKQFYNSGYCSLASKDITRLIKDADKSGTSWSYIYLKDRNNVVLAETINSNNFKGVIGYLILVIDENYFLDIYKDVDIGTGARLFITKSDGTVISSRDKDAEPGSLYKQNTVMENIIKNKSLLKQVFPLKLNKEKNLISYSYIDNINCFMVSIIPYSYINLETKDIKLNIILIFIACLFFSGFLSYIISRSISIPINKIVKLMKQAEKGNMEVKLESSRKDEISYLEEHFNSMFEEIRKLIGQVKEEQRNKREAELSALQAQINPHFLFNTLNSLKWVAVMSQADSVSDGIGALAELLRNTIVDKKELISIKEEIDNIKNYIVIQKIKYGDSFDVEYKINEDLLNYKIIKFILQPVVENSIIHGNENMEEYINIVISCEKQGDKLCIIIKDNGRGMDENKVKELLQQCSESKHKFSSIGIKNVNERIKLNFGEEYGLYIKSKKGTGTEVKMILPLDKGADENV